MPKEGCFVSKSNGVTVVLVVAGCSHPLYRLQRWAILVAAQPRQWVAGLGVSLLPDAGQLQLHGPEGVGAGPVLAGGGRRPPGGRTRPPGQHRRHRSAQEVRDVFNLQPASCDSRNTRHSLCGNRRAAKYISLKLLHNLHSGIWDYSCVKVFQIQLPIYVYMFPYVWYDFFVL